MKPLYLKMLLTKLLIALFLMPAFSQEVIQGSWSMQASSYRKQSGKQFTIEFPPNGTLSDRCWGTDLYTDDSSIGTAAVHAGLITLRDGGTVTIEIKPGAQAYEGSNRNGVTTKSWGVFPGSFVFPARREAPQRTGSSDAAIPAGWDIDAHQYRGKNFRQFTFTFPREGTLSEFVWGSDLYTDHSNIGSAAVHAGILNLEKGGTVTLEIRPGAVSYTGSYRNGVYSRDYEAFEGSFVFVEKKNETSAVIPATSTEVIEGNWTMQASGYRKQTGKRFTISFPAGGKMSDRLWGTDLYTDDSNIATAAVHAGLITLRDGGVVTIEIRQGAGAYEGSVRNGVSSKSWGQFPGSFIFVTK